MEAMPPVGAADPDPIRLPRLRPGLHPGQAMR